MLIDRSGIHALFASALVCIMIATLRAAQITANTIRTDADTDGTWLAVWGMAECAVGKSLVPSVPSPKEFPGIFRLTEFLRSGRHWSHTLIRHPHSRKPQRNQNIGS